LTKDIPDNPGMLELDICLAMCYKELKQYDNAIEILNFLITANDNMAEAYLLRSEVNEELNLHEKAEEDRILSASKNSLIKSLLSQKTITI
jgi:tetratricopeptide (TPR) repeat protein